MLLTDIRKMIGPNTDPCGTPVITKSTNDVKLNEIVIFEANFNKICPII